MCKFCMEHGEGKQWYLQMKNYYPELLHEELNAEQQQVTGAKTRLEWNLGFFRNFVMPGSGKYPLPKKPENAEAAPAASRPPLSEDEIVANNMVEHFGQVLPIEDVERVIDSVDSITRMPCGCRYISTGQTNARYCFGFSIDRFGILGQFPEASASLETLSREEAKKLFRYFDQEGLMHSIWTGVTPYVVGLCNCDHDCIAYRTTIESRRPADFFRAEYICEVDWERCTGCKTCMSQCQFGAQFYSSVTEKVYIDPGRCYGCGVCRAACPNDAISIIPREKRPVAADLWLNHPYPK